MRQRKTTILPILRQDGGGVSFDSIVPRTFAVQHSDGA
jgi:hypothetical protein